MHAIRGAALAVVTVCAAGPAFAEFQYATTAVQDNTINSHVSAGAVANLTGGPDGQTVTYTADANNAEVQFRFDFANPINSTSLASPSFILYGLAVTGSVQLHHVVWSVDTVNAGDPIIFSYGLALSSGSVVQINLSPTQFSPTFNTSTGYQSLFVAFKFINAGDTLTLDAISNPEPGTVALFSLGVAGLGGLVWRRRRPRTA